MSDLTNGSPRGSHPARPLRLEHPLPVGMRDLLPQQAAQRSALTRRLLEAFALHGYQQVVLPAFELVSVLERGLGSLAPDELLQFVEPESGEVVALRPDMTPQVARLLVTRLAEAPSPARLAYQGSVLRRRRARARRHQQIPQAGIELLGSHAAEGDLEVVRVAAAAVRAAGLERFVLDIGHVGIARALLEEIPGGARAGVIEALALKDPAALLTRAEASGLRGRGLSALVELPTLHGGDEIWARAERALSDTAAVAPLGELRRLFAALAEAGLASDVAVDLGELSNFEYYTGMTFQLLAEGPGEALGAGGRYDGLLGRFGVPRPAAGMALDLDNLTWALAHAGRAEPAAPRVLVAAAVADAQLLCTALRGLGLACAPNATHQAEDYARAWDYTHCLRVEAERCVLLDLAAGGEIEISATESAGRAAEVAAALAMAASS